MYSGIAKLLPRQHVSAFVSHLVLAVIPGFGTKWLAVINPIIFVVTMLAITARTKNHFHFHNFLIISYSRHCSLVYLAHSYVLIHQYVCRRISSRCYQFIIFLLKLLDSSLVTCLTSSIPVFLTLIFYMSMSCCFIRLNMGSGKLMES